MNQHLVWPGPNNPIINITFELFIGFDTEGQPVYRHGKIKSKEEVRAVQIILEPLRPSPVSISSVVMGRVSIELANREIITIMPVFHPSLDTYKDLFRVGNMQYHMPASFSTLLERWRHEPD